MWISYEDYWIEKELRGVVEVEDASIAEIDSVKFTNMDTEEEIHSNMVVKGTKVQIEMETRIRKFVNDQNAFEISVISPNGEDITSEVTILGNSIESDIVTLKLNMDTSNLEIGEYTIYLTYGDDTTSTTLQVKEEMIEGNGWYYDVAENKLYIFENHEEKTYDYLRDSITKVEILEPVENVLSNQFKEYQNFSVRNELQ